MSKCPSSIRRRFSNPQPSEHKSSPITTRSGLPPTVVIINVVLVDIVIYVVVFIVDAVVIGIVVVVLDVVT